MGWVLFNLQGTPTLAGYKAESTNKSIKDTSTILQRLLCELRYGLWSNDWFPSETQMCLKHSEASLETTHRHPDHWSVKKPDTRPPLPPLGPEEACAQALYVTVVCSRPVSSSSALSFTLTCGIFYLVVEGKKSVPLGRHCKLLFCDVLCISGFAVG